VLTLRPNISLGLFVDHNSSILKYVKCTQAYALTASPSERERERERATGIHRRKICLGPRPGLCAVTKEITPTREIWNPNSSVIRLMTLLTYLLRCVLLASSITLNITLSALS